MWCHRPELGDSEWNGLVTGIRLAVERTEDFSV